MKHDFMTAADCDCNKEGCCPICDGGLGLCKVCGGAEGSLTTDCPGFKLTASILDGVYTHGLDYKDREGWYFKAAAKG